jgi:hypothetical protein
MISWFNYYLEWHMRRIIENVKKSFDSERTRINKKYSGLQHFWTANDHFSLAEILDEADAAPVAENVVNILVAESDVFSLVHKVQGDIIICDIDRMLLGFIKAQEEFLRQLYERYIKKEITFLTALEEYKQWLKNIPKKKSAIDAFRDRVFKLGRSHFFHNETAYVIAMEALKNKKIVTLDIDLFDQAEQKLLYENLRKQKAKVKLFNATNLPDYDTNNDLSNLFSNIPWDNNPLIAWNIHDRGPTMVHDAYAHYPFLASKVEEYQEHVTTRANLFADLDRVTLGSTTCIYDPYLRRYNVNNERLQEAKHKANRKRYLDRIHANGEMALSIESICQTYNVHRTPRTRNSMNFLIRVERVLEEAYNIICQKYNDEDIKNGASDYFTQWLTEVRKRDLRSPESQSQLKSEMIQSAKDKFRAHRTFDTDKHWICKTVLNLFMLIPILGGIKYAVTGTYFFNAKTRREAMVTERIQQVVFVRG